MGAMPAGWRSWPESAPKLPSVPSEVPSGATTLTLPLKASETKSRPAASKPIPPTLSTWPGPLPLLTMERTQAPVAALKAWIIGPVSVETWAIQTLPALSTATSVAKPSGRPAGVCRISRATVPCSVIARAPGMPCSTTQSRLRAASQAMATGPEAVPSRRRCSTRPVAASMVRISPVRVAAKTVPGAAATEVTGASTAGAPRSSPRLVNR